MDLYNKALNELKVRGTGSSLAQPVQIKSAESGLARVTLRLGDIPRGMRLLQNVTDVQVFAECASILEGLKQVQEAALMYEKAKSYEKAAELYIKGTLCVKGSKKICQSRRIAIFFQ